MFPKSHRRFREGKVRGIEKKDRISVLFLDSLRRPVNHYLDLWPTKRNFSSSRPCIVEIIFLLFRVKVRGLYLKSIDSINPVFSGSPGDASFERNARFAYITLGPN